MFSRSTSFGTNNNTIMYDKGLEVDKKLKPQTDKEKQLWAVVDEESSISIEELFGCEYGYDEPAQSTVMLKDGLDVDDNMLGQTELEKQMWDSLGLDKDRDYYKSAEYVEFWGEMARATGYAKEIAQDAMILALSGIDVEFNEWIVELSKDE